MYNLHYFQTDWTGKVQLWFVILSCILYEYSVPQKFQCPKNSSVTKIPVVAGAKQDKSSREVKLAKRNY